MKASNYTIATLKEIPADADIVSHRLLIRGGFIRKLASGLYTWLPMGLRVLHKVENIIRQEMDASGAQELLMPVIQPAELWKESGRWQKYDDGLLLKFKDRHDRDFCFGPTHEEVITDLARGELRSHKQLPVNFYQIQTKFRDETRPRFGLLRAREFLMKDAYSFHIDQASLEDTYQVMHATYSKILTKMNLDFRSVLADTGSIGGSASQEFHILANSGEDNIAFSTESDYAANVELAEALAPSKSTEAEATLEEVATPNVHTIDQLVEFLNIASDHSVKTLIVKGEESSLVALVLRGDHQLNTLKAEKIEGIASPLTMAEDADIKAALSCSPGSIGTVNLDLPMYVDRSADALVNFTCGANKDDYHLCNVNWGRDCNATLVCDLRDIVEGDPSPDGKGLIAIRRGIEVGHIFQLGNVYSEALKATVLDENGKAVTMMMGCYGMGVSRLVSAVIEQNNDDKGMIWPTVIAPFQAIIIPINGHKSPEVAKAAADIYQSMVDLGIEVIIDDREGPRPGAKFADAELIGIPHRIVVGDRGLKNRIVEYVNRRTGENADLNLKEAAANVSSYIDQDLGIN
ncbi:MAG: proline--tRNA ligase [Pseudomonadales bacterium]|nr:proline--tRNA ligase [Pseudomonadales bacterium]